MAWTLSCRRFWRRPARNFAVGLVLRTSDHHCHRCVYSPMLSRRRKALEHNIFWMIFSR